MPDAILVHAPASKSISHRLLIASALACGTSTLEGVLASDDTLRTRQILSLAGADFEPLPSRQGTESFRIRGANGRLAGGTRKTDVAIKRRASVDEREMLVETVEVYASAGVAPVFRVARHSNRSIVCDFVDILSCCVL